MKLLSPGEGRIVQWAYLSRGIVATTVRLESVLAILPLELPLSAQFLFQVCVRAACGVAGSSLQSEVVNRYKLLLPLTFVVKTVIVYAFFAVDADADHLPQLTGILSIFHLFL